jgi:hypothetical protein
MAKRLYTLQDIKDFLKNEYNIDWQGAVVKNGKIIYLKEDDLHNPSLRILAIVNENNSKAMYRIAVSNTSFGVYGKSSYHKSKRWQKILAERLTQEQNQQSLQ